MLGSVSDPNSDVWSGINVLLNTKSFIRIYVFSGICHRMACILPWFTLILHYISINFSRISPFFFFFLIPLPPTLRDQKKAKHTGPRTSETHTPGHLKTRSLVGKPELSVTDNTDTTNFPTLQGQRSFKMFIKASGWQLEPFMQGMGSAPAPELPWLWVSAWYGKQEPHSNIP